MQETKTDGREPGNWETRYEGQAVTRIRLEAGYVAVSFLGSLALIGVVALNSETNFVGFAPGVSEDSAPFALSLLGGCLGGTMFAMKWLYHSVAKNTWNADRRLWRLFTPLLSGGAAFSVVLLSSAGVLPLFGPDVLASRAGALGVGLLLGYFSDRVFSVLEGFAKQNLGERSKDAGTETDLQEK